MQDVTFNIFVNILIRKVVSNVSHAEMDPLSWPTF